MGFPGSLDGKKKKKSACNAGDPCSNPGLGRSPREGNGYPLQCCSLEMNLKSHKGYIDIVCVCICNTYTCMCIKPSSDFTHMQLAQQYTQTHNYTCPGVSCQGCQRAQMWQDTYTVLCGGESMSIWGFSLKFPSLLQPLPPYWSELGPEKPDFSLSSPPSTTVSKGGHILN